MEAVLFAWISYAMAMLFSILPFLAGDSGMDSWRTLEILRDSLW
ncbi:MAG: hypothetical protein ACTSU5_21690 [Promethearchaeota archaeon]